MKIKKLELVGFKSFVDRTVLHFDHDMLAIVGPNGCGKSNIVDAIRWCMGEQSARHLRGRSMDDVIFNGSESRTPHDFAEVTLTFENNVPEELPIEYRQYSELAVTRRLHRSGESEYLVNKTAVRLRDVTDLFLGTGAGTKAYSIVEQGKVGLIVSAKPEDRRLLIEEAAGITKFKARKKQAEKKMELTQQNLLRVGDLVSEVERSLVSLKRQAAKAERYVSYRNELEDLLLHEASHRYLELVGWTKLETSEVERARGEDELVRGEIVAREGELEAFRLEVLASEKLLDAATSASFAADKCVSEEEAAIERSKDKLAALTHREQQAEGERRQMNEEARRLAAERTVVSGDIEVLARTEAEAATHIAGQESALDEHARTHRAADARVVDRRHVLASARTEIARAETSLAGFERRHGEMMLRRERLGVERESLLLSRGEIEARAREQAQSVVEVRSARASATTEREEIERRLIDLKQAVIDEERSLDTLKGDLAQKRSRHDAIEEMHARLDGIGVGPKTLVGSHDGNVFGLVADRIEAPEALTQALAGLLGASLQYVLVRDVERGASMLEELGRARKGRATIVSPHPAFVAGAGCRPLPSDDAIVGRLVDLVAYAPEDEALVRSLVGDSLVVRDLAGALRLRREGLGAVLVALDGAVLHEDGRIEGGQGDELAAGMIDSKREARELMEEIERLGEAVSRQFDALQGRRGELATAMATLDRVRHHVHARDLALVAAEKDFQKSEGQAEALVRRLEALTSEDSELTVVVDGAVFERDEAARALSEATARAAAVQEELAEAEAILADARERLEKQRHAVTAAKVDIAGARERLTAARGTEARLARSIAELDERIARIAAELAANAAVFEETTVRLTAHRQGLESALDRSREAAAELSSAREAFERLRAVLLEREATVKEIRIRVDVVREDLRAHEMALRERRMALEHLLAGVADKFRGLHLPRIVGDYHMRPPPDDVSRTRIEELERLVERMGSVNLDAMREHAEAEERFNFLSTQKADLDKALSDLQRAIGQMNKESRRLFETTFEAINASFREIFPRMFRGGRAELRLTNPADLLETGVDIVAQPPGKKLSSIELMSGGEKALTAVSLIFAIFQIRPSPFCILDEVDAPLDEANVAHYNETIRSMTDRSQFILITHVKRTMQMVDVLYGVTMPEAGVSKIVSVKMNDAPARAVVREELREAVA